jgi:hypothetical protein
MLTSITPLGERSRGFSWGLTATWFAIAAIVAGTLAGAVAGAVGSLGPAGDWRSAVLLAGVVLALCVDATALGDRLPSTRRQVNEDWMVRYRGWVYGSAFGAQLGVGLATVVTSAAIYLAAIGAVLCGSIEAGALVGGVFGMTRALSLLPAGSAFDRPGLVRLHRGLARFQPWARWAVVAAELVAMGLTIGGLA